MTKLNFQEPHTPEEEIAIEILKNAPLETDEDYVALTQLIDSEVSELTNPGSPS